MITYRHGIIAHEVHHLDLQLAFEKVIILSLIHIYQLVIPHIRIGAVAQKDINQAVLRVCPGASARETGMAVDRSRGRPVSYTHLLERLQREA